jgi:hypothetical protein
MIIPRALKLGRTNKIIKQMNMPICNLTTDLFSTRYSIAYLLWCIMTLWDYKYFIIKRDVNRLPFWPNEALVIPTFPFSRKPEKMTNTNISWRNMDCVLTTFGMIIDQSTNNNSIVASKIIKNVFWLHPIVNENNQSQWKINKNSLLSILDD